ncbi:MAG: AmmeMemoRadiSam system radical SAM enzyme [Desulfuromonadales bacterium]|nr:AmmeMemoRadiSam system radical SAM enzyme [Desulfuromonadales bacterium]
MVGLHEAEFWEPLAEGKVRCNLCRFHCTIAAGRHGLCGVRENRAGRLYTLVYGRCIAEHVDPIEKKPLFHFLPGSRSLSVATVGCNFRCLHCQNADISQWPQTNRQIPGRDAPPEALVAQALENRCASISYTYTEPTVFFEYARATAVKARAAGLQNVFVTNGYTSSQALEAIAPWLDAANVDLKGFDDAAYRRVTGASLDGVLACLRDYRRLGIWLEVTTLVIPGHNDDTGQLRKIADFIAVELGVETPWHVTAFHPAYKMLDRPATPLNRLLEARQVGRDAGLQYVYLGNVAASGGEDTLCPGCGATVVRRGGMRLLEVHLDHGRCVVCQQPIAGRFVSL